MRRLLMIAGGVIGVLILIIAAVVGYAYFNLNSIIESNRARILDHASAALGRPVTANEIKASLGWGVSIEVTGVKVADDDAFSQLPFVEADSVLAKVEFVPLLFREIKVIELVLQQPQIRIVRNPSGALNVNTLAKKRPRRVRGEEPGVTPQPGASPGSGLGAAPNISANAPETAVARRERRFTIENFTVKDGQILYLDNEAGGAPVTINRFNLKVTHFGLAKSFDIALELAALGDTRNLEVNGTAGPIVKDGAIDTGAILINLNATAGPFKLAELKAVPQLAKALPPALAFSGEANLQAKVAGTLDAISLDASSDLSAIQVTYAPSFDKPAGTTLKFTASGARTDGKIVLQQVNLELADLRAKLTYIAFAPGSFSARADTNKFDLGPVAKLIARAHPFNPSGAAEIHTAIRIANSKPEVDGTVILTNVNAAMPNAKTPPVSNLNGIIRLSGNTAVLGPLTFKLGSGNAQFQAKVDSIKPVHATYRLGVDKITVAELVPGRSDKGNENLVQVSANGTVANDGGTFGGATKLSAASGMIANVPFTLLALDADYSGDQVNANSLKFGAFDGSIGASGVATIGKAGVTPAFDFKVDAQSIDMQKALDSQHSKAANTIRGSLTGNIQIAGKGKGLDQVKPTMRGSGRARIDNGKLVGVNIVAQALKKVDNVPGIGALVPASVVANHPELFKSPDTDIQEASLTFAIAGPRIVSHDLVARSTDYSIFGDGWFDLDKNIDLTAKIIMSSAFSSELVAAKHNISYLTNNDNQVEIPLRISGQLPHPAVVPDVAIIAQRAATHAMQGKVGELLQKKGLGGILKKNGLGGLLGF